MAKPKTPQKPIAAALETPGSQEAYDHFLPAAQALDAAAVRSFRADASVAYHNVKAGADALVPLEARIKVELPTVPLKILLGLPDLALAVLFAAAQVDRGADGSTTTLLARARDLRDLLLSSAEALAKAGILPPRAVEKIREGKLVDAMQPPWKLVVDDLGRIDHAEIEARPLLLFVGANNTGKTYSVPGRLSARKRGFTSLPSPPLPIRTSRSAICGN